MILMSFRLKWMKTQEEVFYFSYFIVLLFTFQDGFGTAGGRSEETCQLRQISAGAIPLVDRPKRQDRTNSG